MENDFRRQRRRRRKNRTSSELSDFIVPKRKLEFFFSGRRFSVRAKMKKKWSNWEQKLDLKLKKWNFYSIEKQDRSLRFKRSMNPSVPSVAKFCLLNREELLLERKTSLDATFSNFYHEDFLRSWNLVEVSSLIDFPLEFLRKATIRNWCWTTKDSIDISVCKVNNRRCRKSIHLDKYHSDRTPKRSSSEYCRNVRNDVLFSGLILYEKKKSD